MSLEPIGRVTDGYQSKDEAPTQGRREKRQAVLELNPELAPALEGLGPGSWIWLLLWFDRARPAKLKVHPRGDKTRPLTGLFNSRSPNRINSIGLDLVRIESITGPTLVVTFCDAVTGTPVLDIKPYIEAVDKPLS